jgi:hypothetical protein
LEQRNRQITLLHTILFDQEINNNNNDLQEGEQDTYEYYQLYLLAHYYPPCEEERTISTSTKTNSTSKTKKEDRKVNNTNTTRTKINMQDKQQNIPPRARRTIQIMIPRKPRMIGDRLYTPKTPRQPRYFFKT